MDTCPLFEYKTLKQHTPELTEQLQEFHTGKGKKKKPGVEWRKNLAPKKDSQSSGNLSDHLAGDTGAEVGMATPQDC